MARDKPEIARRVRAARVIAGFDTVVQLAARIDTDGLGAKTLGAIERGERSVRDIEITAIARACELPERFFTADLRELEGSPDPGGVLDRIEALESRVQAIEGSGLPRAVERLTDALLGETSAAPGAPGDRRT